MSEVGKSVADLKQKGLKLYMEPPTPPPKKLIHTSTRNLYKILILNSYKHFIYINTVLYEIRNLVLELVTINTSLSVLGAFISHRPLFFSSYFPVAS